MAQHSWLFVSHLCAFVLRRRQINAYGVTRMCMNEARMCMNNYDGWKDGSFFVDSRRWKRPFHLIADNHLKYIKTDASQKPLKALIFRKFSTRKLLAENTRVLRGFAKRLAFSRLTSKNHKIPFDGWKKSTPKKNLALTFSDRACLQKRKSAQKSANILHKTALAVQN